MKYISTRGDAPSLSFEEVVLAGLANDGGLYVPETMPSFSQAEIASWVGLSYQELMFNIITPFVDGEVSDADLKERRARWEEGLEKDIYLFEAVNVLEDLILPANKTHKLAQIKE